MFCNAQVFCAMLFQSTLLQEERHFLMSFTTCSSNFNPRSYKRSDSCRMVSYARFPQFQSTLLQEERPYPSHLQNHLLNFNPRSYKRSDPDLYCLHGSSCHFNPRSYKRSDTSIGTVTVGPDDFNPRSYKRSDGKNAQLSLYLSVIIIA